MTATQPQEARQQMDKRNGFQVQADHALALQAQCQQEARQQQIAMGNWYNQAAFDALTKERDEWKAKAEAERDLHDITVKHAKAQHAKAQASDAQWNVLVEFWQKKAKATEHLADTCGTLRTANMELLAENAQLRRRIEKLERKK